MEGREMFAMVGDGISYCRFAFLFWSFPRHGVCSVLFMMSIPIVNRSLFVVFRAWNELYVSQ